MEPAADHLVQMFLHTQETFHGLAEEQQPKEMEHYVSSGMVGMIDYIYDNFEVFELLLDASYGTKFQDFVERLVEIETEYTYKYMEAIHYQTEDGEVITEDFIYIMTRALFESMFEVVRHKMTKETALRYMDMLEKYHCGRLGTVVHDKNTANAIFTFAVFSGFMTYFFFFLLFSFSSSAFSFSSSLFARFAFSFNLVLQLFLPSGFSRGPRTPVTFVI